jgi:hypothetical protein
VSGAIVTVVLLLAAGAPLARSRDLFRWLAESFLLGAGLGFALMLGESMLHIPWTRAGIMLPLIAVAAIGIVVRRHALRVTMPRVHWLDLVTLAVIAGYARFAAMAPTPEYDFIGIWGVKAKELFLARGIDWTWLANPFNQFAHVDYPLLVPLTFDLQMFVSGGWPDRWLGAINVAFGVAALLMLRGFLDEEMDRRRPGGWPGGVPPPDVGAETAPGQPARTPAVLVPLATIALAWTALSPWIGLAEGPLVAYGTSGLLFIRRGEIGRGAVFLGLAASCKNEGLTLIVAAAIALWSIRNLWRLWPAAAISAPWLILRAAHHLQSDLTSGPILPRVIEHLSHPGPMLHAMAVYSLGKPLFWSGILLALVIGFRSLRRERFLLVAIVVQLAFFIAAYLVTPHDVTWHVRWSWERIVTQLAAVIGFLAVVVLPLDDRR